MPGISHEIKFKTARSGGKGGQNVNKVETMVEGYWDIESSAVFTSEEKQRIAEKLASKINSKGFLMVKSQEFRSQLENKEAVIKKMNSLVKQSLRVPKPRKATKPTKASVEKRIESKTRVALVKQDRKKIKYEE